MTTDYRALIGALDARHVDFVVIGAIAMVLHGSARVTRDLDICYSRESANLKALAASLKPSAAAMSSVLSRVVFR